VDRVSSTSKWISGRWGAVASIWIFLLLGAGWLGSTAGALGCSENLALETTRERVCSSFGLSDFGSRDWLLFASAPALLFMFGLLALQQVRRRPAIVGRVLLGGLIAIDGVILLLVT
jgi:hypothetical protein